MVVMISVADADADTRSRILGKAEELFLRYGFSRVTVDEIAGELGMSKKTIYKNFNDKKDMIRAVVQKNQEGLVAAIDTILADRKTEYAARLASIFGILSRFFSRITEVFITDLKKNCPDILRQINDFKKKVSAERISRVLNEGRKKGMIRTDINPVLISRIYIRIFETLIIPENFTDTAFSAKDMFDAVIRILYNGILTESGRSGLEKAVRPVPKGRQAHGTKKQN